MYKCALSFQSSKRGCFNEPNVSIDMLRSTFVTLIAESEGGGTYTCLTASLILEEF